MLTFFCTLSKAFLCPYTVLEFKNNNNKKKSIPHRSATLEDQTLVWVILNCRVISYEKTLPLAKKHHISSSCLNPFQNHFSPSEFLITNEKNCYTGECVKSQLFIKSIFYEKKNWNPTDTLAVLQAQLLAEKKIVFSISVFQYSRPTSHLFIMLLC